MDAAQDLCATDCFGSHMTDRIRRIVADVLGVPLSRVSAGSRQEEAWESLAQIRIIMAVENEFDVTFSAEEVQALNSVPKILEALAKQKE